MTRLNWTVQSTKAVHLVTLEYSFWTCRHRLFVDNQLVWDKRVLRELGTEVEFLVGAHKATLFVDVPGHITFAHYLTVAGCPVTVCAESEPSIFAFPVQTTAEEGGMSVAPPPM